MKPGCSDDDNALENAKPDLKQFVRTRVGWCKEVGGAEKVKTRGFRMGRNQRMWRFIFIDD